MPRAINREHNFNEIPSIFPIMSTSSRYVLKTDISRFYPTIYTHSIPWVCHGKQYSKTHKKASIYGNELDTNVRNTQDQQTFGIPIGPDSSYVIAELIGSRIDQEIYNELHLDGIRYLDDYYFFTNSLSEAEEALTRIQRISKFYELEINPEKTKIYELPESLEYNWTSEIRSFKFHGSVKRQKTDLVTFFSKAYEYCKKYPDEYVLKYSLARIKNELISRENWELYESLILNSMIAEPSVIPTVLEIFLAYLNAGYNLNLKKIEKTINNLICYHSKLGHGFEVSWCLWLAKSLSIKISRSAAKEISQMDDTIAVLTALDLRNDGLVQSGLDLSAWNNICTHENLYQEKWIFAYEAIKKGWLSSRTNYIGNDAFFSQLELRNVEFYDASLQVIPAVLNSSTQNNRNTYSFGSGGAGGY
ncbi:reverse transcriptase [Paenibacillus faecis]|uniref:RNA-directed DNA polymerase n=1 Tax=Paenibacillus faecis TaxID=862114 RepID=UPI001B0C154D|nr:RNA-directed DNA polymerase [Paenibacillus faecis]GIO83260.1 reverse transcriptase [Paenibacillus faecis]